MMLSQKYAPKTSSQIVGNPQNIEIIKNFIFNYSRQKKKALLLYGPSGVGKTQSLHTLAKEFDLELLELNASDLRNKEVITQIVGNFIKQQSLFQKTKVMLVDEIDGLSGQEDKGGVQAVSELLEESFIPIIFTANNPFDTKLSTIRKKSLLLEFKELPQVQIQKVLQDIVKKESKEIQQDTLFLLSQYSNGDLRGAINDLQVLIENRQNINIFDLGLLSKREHKNTIFESLKVIFQSRDLNKVLFSLDNADFDIDEAFLWLEENIPYEYSGQSLKNAYYYLSRADVMRGRIRRRQYWRLMSYQVDLMTVGVALAKQKASESFVSYKRTQKILKIWLANQKYQKRKQIIRKISEKTHTSTKKAFNSFYYIKEILKKKKNTDMIKELDLNEEEVDYLLS